MKRFDSISIYGSKTNDSYVIPVVPTGKRIVDDSKFIPMSEAVKQLSKIPPLTKGVIEGFYDFPDGKDDGRKVEVARLRPEIVELSSEVRKQNEKIKKNLRKAQKIAEDKAIIESFRKPQTTNKE